jgi:hypothetical protein
MKIHITGKTLILGLALFLFVSPLQIFADITMFGSEKIELSRSKIPQSLTWSDSFQQLDDGLKLGKKNEVDSSPYWIQSQIIPFGLEKPPTSAAIFLNIDGDIPKEFWQSVSVYHRYSTDKIHWSSWIHSDSITKGDKSFDFWAELNSEVNKDAPLYNMGISIPSVSRKEYNNLHKVWIRTEEYSSENSKYLEWLAKNHPSVLEKEIPSIRYIQFRIEGNVYWFKTAARLKAFNISYMYRVSGLGYFDPIDKDSGKSKSNTKQ